MSNITELEKYIWRSKDELGRGATATVFKAMNKSTGEAVAAKVFNSSLSLNMRTNAIKEFNLLRSFDHQNIVKLKDFDNKRRERLVLIIEYCGGGSLYDVLDRPENAFGLCDSEFLIVLRDVCAGLQYLRDKSVVHRDIKPGNIMRDVARDGTSIYKLSDFGAAKDLEDEDHFKSICGTVEYLHPDMYDAAIIRQTFGRQFTAQVDIWSLGCTLYHCATGRLPFRPKDGRRNTEDMRSMLLKKPTGSIGASNEKIGGKIDYEMQLPDTCRITQGLQTHVFHLLEKTIERDSRSQFDFHELFKYVDALLGFRASHIFIPMIGCTITFYCPPTERWASVKAKLVEVTRFPDIQLKDLHHQGTPLTVSLTEEQHVQEYPHTTLESPLILLTRTDPSDTYQSKMTEHRFKPIQWDRKDMNADYKLAKRNLRIMYLYKRRTEICVNHASLFESAAEVYTHSVKIQIDRAKSEFSAFRDQLDEQSDYIFSVKESLDESVKDNSSKSELLEKLAEVTKKVSEVRIYASNLQELLNQITDRIVEGRTALGDSKRLTVGFRSEHYVEKIQQLIDESALLMKDLKCDVDDQIRDRNALRMHSFYMRSLDKNWNETRDLLMTDIYDGIDEIFNFYSKWFRVARKQALKAEHLQTNIQWSYKRRLKITSEFQSIRKEMKSSYLKDAPDGVGDVSSATHERIRQLLKDVQETQEDSLKAAKATRKVLEQVISEGQ